MQSLLKDSYFKLLELALIFGDYSHFYPWAIQSNLRGVNCYFNQFTSQNSLKKLCVEIIVVSQKKSSHVC